jgi:hypothetical protein
VHSIFLLFRISVSIKCYGIDSSVSGAHPTTSTWNRF